jgi:hypothetical protein
MKTTSPMTPAASPKKALDHFRSSPALEVGGGRALLSFAPSMSNPATDEAYSD